MRRFDGQVAIVVGGGQGVGLGAAVRMGREGASIVLVEADRVKGERAADLLDAQGIQGRLLLGDPADPAAAKWAATTAKLVWGRVDAVVYAVPMPDTPGPVHAVGPKALDAHYRVDVRGAAAVLPSRDSVNDGARIRTHRDRWPRPSERRAARAALRVRRAMRPSSASRRPSPRRSSKPASSSTPSSAPMIRR